MMRDIFTCLSARHLFLFLPNKLFTIPFQFVTPFLIHTILSVIAGTLWVRMIPGRTGEEIDGDRRKKVRTMILSRMLINV